MNRPSSDIVLRAALWQANRKRCFFCEELIAFRDLEIDHLIPESIPADRLAGLRLALGLADSFEIQSLSNLVPTHHNCNSRKSDRIFSEANLRFCFEIWLSKQRAVVAEVEQLEKQAANENLLIPLAAKVQRGGMTVSEAISFLRKALSDRPDLSAEPTIVTFGTNLTSRGIPPSAAVYDTMERALLEHIYAKVPCPASMSEASLRTGETLTVRMAFWLFDLNRLKDITLPGWEITELAHYSDVYG